MGGSRVFVFPPSRRVTMTDAKAFDILIGLLLTLVLGLSGWALRTVLGLKSRIGRLQSQLDVMEARTTVILEGADGKEGILGDIRYLRTRVGWVGRATHTLRDRFYYHERQLKLDGMPPLELPPE